MPTDTGKQLDRDAVAQAMVDCGYSIDRSAKKLGVTYLMLNDFIDSHPKLRNLLKLGDSVHAPSALEVIDREPTLPAETRSVRPAFNDEAMKNALQTAGFDEQMIENNITRAQCYREMGTALSDMINCNSLINFMNLQKLAQQIQQRLETDQYNNQQEKFRDFEALEKCHKLMIKHQDILHKGQLVDAKVQKIRIEGQFKKAPPANLPQQPQKRGRGAWPQKVKHQSNTQVNTEGPVHLHFDKK